MIDIHCHILPGIDDGPKDLDEALAMLRLSAEDGVRTLVATPHWGGRFGAQDPDEIRRLVRCMDEIAREEQIPVRILPGCEADLTPELPERVRSGEVLTLGEGGRYVLVEVNPEPIPVFGLEVMFQLRLAGLTPILSHGERLALTRSGRQFVENFVEQGGLVQMNADAVGGLVSWHVKRVCRGLRKARLAHIIASDGHSTERRPPLLTPCLRGFGLRERRSALEQYCRFNPLLNGRQGTTLESSEGQDEC